MVSNTLERILAVSDHNCTLKERVNSYLDECRKNVRFETACIAMCGLGDIAIGFIAYAAGLPFVNGIGFFGSVAVGGFYAYSHILKHGREHTSQASKLDALFYGLTTESSCVISGSGVEYIVGKVITNVSNDPFNSVNLSLRIGAMAPAFVLGLAAMSGLTWLKRNEAYRCLAQEESLQRVHEVIQNYHPCEIKDSKVIMPLNKSRLIIKEKEVPRSYQNNETNNLSLYTASSPLAQHHPEVRNDIGIFMKEIFEEAGQIIYPVENIFSHQNW